MLNLNFIWTCCLCCEEYFGVCGLMSDTKNIASIIISAGLALQKKSHKFQVVIILLYRMTMNTQEDEELSTLLTNC